MAAQAQLASSDRQNMLKLLFHSLTCTRKRAECPVALCGTGKDVILHVLHCDSSSCDDGQCAAVKEALDHYIFCEEPSCELCSNILPTSTEHETSCSKVNASNTTVALSSVSENPSVVLAVMLITSILKRNGDSCPASLAQSKALIRHIIRCGDRTCTERGCCSSKAVLTRCISCQDSDAELSSAIAKAFCNGSVCRQRRTSSIREGERSRLAAALSMDKHQLCEA